MSVMSLSRNLLIHKPLNNNNNSNSVIHDFICSRLDYMQQIAVDRHFWQPFFGVYGLCKTLQLPVLHGVSHSTSFLRQLHWQPVWQRIEFKLADLVYRLVWIVCIRIPQYLEDDSHQPSTTLTVQRCYVRDLNNIIF